MKAGTLVLTLAIAAPAAARGDAMNPRSIGLPASAIAAGQNSAGALDEGRMLLAGNDPAQAISAFRLALAHAPQSVSALNGLAVAYDRLGRSDLARQHFEMALALEPDAADIAYNLGLALVRAGQDRAAIPHLQRAAIGNDARAAAAARRTLAQVAARLTTPPALGAAAVMSPAPPVLAAAAAAGPRIDMASSGEAVLVLAPSVSAAPAGLRPTPTRMAAVEPALADRLGDAAALTIPMALAAAAPAPSAQPEPRRVASRTPALAKAAPAVPALPDQPSPAQPANLPALAMSVPSRLPAATAPLVHVRRDVATDRWLADWRSQHATLPAPRQSPLPDPRKALVRLVIARLETVPALIGGQRG